LVQFLGSRSVGGSVERDPTYEVKTYAGNLESDITIGESPTLSSYTCTEPSESSSISTEVTCGDGGVQTIDGMFEDEWTLGSPVSPDGCGFDIVDHYQWCALTPNKTFGTVSGYVDQTEIDINGYVTPPSSNKMPDGMVIGP